MAICKQGSCRTVCNGQGRDELLEALFQNIGRVVTVFTTSGGISGEGFTGLLVSVGSCIVKLVTTLPTAPPNPFGGGCNSTGARWNNRFCVRGSNALGSVVRIPLDKIVSLVTPET